MKKLIIILSLFISYSSYAQYVPKAGNKLNTKPNGILVPTSTTDDTPITRIEVFNTGVSTVKPGALDTTSLLATKANSLTLAQTFTRFGSGNFFPQPAVFTGGGTSTGDYFNIIGATGVSGTGALLMGTSPTMTTPTLGAATATSINKVTLTEPTTNATLTLVQGSSLITAGAFSNTITTTANTTVTFPTTGTLYGTATGSITSAQLLASLSNETGTGTAVFSASPTFTGTPLAPTAVVTTNTTQIATTAYVKSQILTATSTLDFPSTAMNQNSQLTVTVTGAAVGDVVSVNWPATLAPPTTWNGTISGFVSATNTVTVIFMNNDPLAVHDLASASFVVKVFK